MARKTTKITMTSPAGHEITLKPARGGGYWISCGRTELGNSSGPELTEGRLRDLDGILGDIEEHGDYVPFSAAIDGGAY